MSCCDLLEDYQYFQGIGTYKLHTRGATFFRARQICKEEGGHLAIINSLAEEKVLLDLFKRPEKFVNVMSNERALLGIHDIFAEGEWETIFGQSLYRTGFSKWSNNWNGQPDDSKHILNCGFLLKSGGLDDDLCDAQHPFFCEIPEYCVAYL
ncbi:Similar to Hemolymph lipopolysaccharide-binding protein (Periplaneta americana) [Cotesia congregata]|uniref:Similar to Hemolymph lipopolysaccharide-binding protein (Periplaneta americana) n=1 Tax=Cotesia congregata TaxID=51543 RepID=A0A8J2HSH9_COTCN|nr:Similar to Hemolymph lipopolysaccharide-binding protein (Periplaneta americana) [Cotesia congregata]